MDVGSQNSIMHWSSLKTYQALAMPNAGHQDRGKLSEMIDQ